MKIKKIAGCIGVGGALCVVTGGLAAPAIGAAVGSTFMGLSGAAATSAGLAALGGGGSLAAGGLGMAGGTALIQAVAGGVGVLGAGIATNFAEGRKAKEQNEELREELKRSNLDSATKQKVIMQLNKKNKTNRFRIRDGKTKSNQNTEKNSSIRRTAKRSVKNTRSCESILIIAMDKDIIILKYEQEELKAAEKKTIVLKDNNELQAQKVDELQEKNEKGL